MLVGREAHHTVGTLQHIFLRCSGVQGSWCSRRGNAVRNHIPIDLISVRLIHSSSTSTDWIIIIVSVHLLPPLLRQFLFQHRDPLLSSLSVLSLRFEIFPEHQQLGLEEGQSFLIAGCIPLSVQDSWSRCMILSLSRIVCSSICILPLCCTVSSRIWKRKFKRMKT